VGRGLSETTLRILDRLGLAMTPNVERARDVGDAATLARALRYVGDDYTRGDAAKALAEEGGMGAEILLNALAEPEPRVRATAAEGLRRVAWKDVDDTVRARAGVRLIAALGDSNPGVRSAAAGALGRVGGTGAVRALRAASTDSVESVRLGVASALGRLLPNKIRQWEYEPPTPDWMAPRPMPEPMRSSEDPHPGSWQVKRMPPILRMKRALASDHLSATEVKPEPLPRPEPEPSTAPPTLPPSRPLRLAMIDCPRCQKLSSPRFVRCHRC
jgi:HEAT repeats